MAPRPTTFDFALIFAIGLYKHLQQEFQTEMIKVQKTSKTILSMPETRESRFRGSLKIIIRFRSTNADTNINEHDEEVCSVELEGD